MSTETTVVVAIEDVRVATTHGHVFWLKAGVERELGNSILQHALATGKVSIVSKGAPKAQEPAELEAAELTREEQITAAVFAVAERGNPVDFTAQGKPKVAVIAAECGIADVRAAEIEAALEN